jgi:hypothetical protein
VTFEIHLRPLVRPTQVLPHAWEVDLWLVDEASAGRAQILAEWVLRNEDDARQFAHALLYAARHGSSVVKEIS